MKATAEERQRVHEDDCKAKGHSYTHLEIFGVDGPIAVVCTHCGRQWKVENNSYVGQQEGLTI